MRITQPSTPSGGRTAPVGTTPIKVRIARGGQ